MILYDFIFLSLHECQKVPIHQCNLLEIRKVRSQSWAERGWEKDEERGKWLPDRGGNKRGDYMCILGEGCGVRREGWHTYLCFGSGDSSRAGEGDKLMTALMNHKTAHWQGSREKRTKYHFYQRSLPSPGGDMASTLLCRNPQKLQHLVWNVLHMKAMEACIPLS